MELSPRLLVITDLLLGAVFADERLEGGEIDAVKNLLSKLTEQDELPEDLVDHINGFDPDSFDLEETAAEFTSDPITSRRKLLELVAAVFDADGEVDFDEDDYLRSLAEALEMDEEDYRDLVIEYEVEDLSDFEIDIVVAIPPPIPES